MQKKQFVLVSFFLLCGLISSAQNPLKYQEDKRKGSVYFYWGWNRAWFSDSDITFKGENYDFTLKKVAAYDRQSALNIDTYLNPFNITLPQYDFRIGYFFSKNYSVSFGVDHMKYVMQGDQTVKISGNIHENTNYDGTYSGEDIVLKGDFLQFEHTDGLNYVNLEVRRTDEVFRYKKISINLTEGLGGGFLFPRTNTLLLSKERYDEFHLSGYGISAVAGVNLTFYNFFFVQTEFKGGFIDMPDIRTTKSATDKASQNFFFGQANLDFGISWNFSRKKAE